MTNSPISTKQFVWWVVLVTIGFTFLILTHGVPSFLFTFPLLAASFVIMPAADRKRPLTRSQLLGALAVVLATAGLIWWCIAHRTEASQSWGRSLIDFYSQPIVAVPIWVIFMYLGYRRWRIRSREPHSTSPL